MPINLNEINHILLSRTDNIGDVTLSLPIAAWIKSRAPHIKITWLGSAYAGPVVACCPHIDHFLDWPSLEKKSRHEQIKQIQASNYQAVIHIYPNQPIARLMQQAKIPVRIGTSNRWYHWLTCQYRPKFSRSRSQLHEAQLNFKLLEPFGETNIPSISDLAPLISINKPINQAHTNTIQSLLKVEPFNLIIHPYSNGSGREWPIDNFISLINNLESESVNLIITGSTNESLKIKEKIQPHCPGIQDCSGQLSLAELISLIQQADGLIAASTGPLHIAAATGIKTLGLYPPKPGINPQRWGPIGTAASSICVKNSCNPTMQ